MSVLFDQLRISDDGTQMYINAHVNTASTYANVSIENISIVPADKVSEIASFSEEDCIYTKDYDDATTEVGLVLSVDDFTNYTKTNLSGVLFFIFIKSKDSVTLDETSDFGTTFDTKMLYQKVMNFTKSALVDPGSKVAFTDFILLWNAFKASVETEHYVPAIKYFNMLFDIADDVK